MKKILSIVLLVVLFAMPIASASACWLNYRCSYTGTLIYYKDSLGREVTRCPNCGESRLVNG